MDFKTILYSVEDGIATITINRPHVMNAITFEVIEEWRAAIETAADDDAVKVVIVTGAGRTFSAGGDPRMLLDLREKNPLPPIGQRRNIKMQTMLNLARVSAMLEKPYIAAVNGPAIGGGMDIISLCDIRIASDKARFGSGFVRMGEIPTAGGCYSLPRIVGIAKACELIWTGKIITAEEALRIGYVSQVVPNDQLMPTVRELALQLAKGPTIAINLTKRLIHRCLDLDFDTAMELHLIGQGVIETTEDAREGPRAWVEKREPQFKGR